MTVEAFDLLLSPLELRSFRLKNRVVFTAHTASFSQDGLPGVRARRYYEARAAGGAALIVLEPLPVLGSGGVTPQNYRWQADGFVPALREVAAAVHEHGTLLVSQLYHLGPNADPVATMQGLWSVSTGAPPDGGPGSLREIDDRDIAALVAGHVRAARAALAGGLDGVECMFAYDTLVDGFMSGARNRRSDAYGGTFENRMRLPCAILDALRDVLGPDPLLGVTVTASMPGYVEAVRYLHERCDVDYFGIGNGDYDHLELLMPPLDFEPGFGVRFAEPVKRAVPDAVVLAEGRITRPEIAERALLAGACDLVGMTRAQIADPELVRKTAERRDAEIRECVALNVCVARRLSKFPIACVQNPDAGFESDPVPRASSPRVVVVVGGGVAGLEAARVAALAGHRVTLVEKAGALGGQVALTARLPFQAAHRHLVDWRVSELERLGVRVEIGFAADAETVSRLEPDVVLVATGSEPGEVFSGAVAATAVLEGRAPPGESVVVLDEEGHRKGAGVAEVLAVDGRRVALVGVGVAPTGHLTRSLADRPLLGRLQKADVRILRADRVVEVGTGEVVVAVGDAVQTLAADLVVHAGRHRPVDGLVFALRAAGFEAVAVGDARVPRLVEDAIRSGYETARSL